jgi:hypothetical protein
MIEIIVAIFAVLFAAVTGGFVYRLGLKDGLKLNKDAGGARLDPAFTLPKIPSKEERERSKMENKKAIEELARDIAVMDYKSKVKYDGER